MPSDSSQQNVLMDSVPDSALVTMLYLSKCTLHTMPPSFTVHNGLILAYHCHYVLCRRDDRFHALIVPSADPVTSFVGSNCRHTMPPSCAFHFRISLDCRHLLFDAPSINSAILASTNQQIVIAIAVNRLDLGAPTASTARHDYPRHSTPQHILYDQWIR